MNTRGLLEALFVIVPSFFNSWHSQENCFLNQNGTTTLHGVCARLGSFLEGEYESLTPGQWEELFAFVEQNVSGRDGPDTKLDNALCTCFLEDISSTACGEAAKPWMGSKSRWYFDQWHVWPPR